MRFVRLDRWDGTVGVVHLAGPIEFSVSELLLIFVVGGLVVLAALGITIWGIVRAAQQGDTVWLIGIIAGFFFGFGWAVAIVYLLTSRRGRSWERKPAQLWVTDTPHFCTKCGSALVPGGRFCKSCGTRIQAQMSLER